MCHKWYLEQGREDQFLVNVKEIHVNITFEIFRAEKASVTIRKIKGLDRRVARWSNLLNNLLSITSTWSLIYGQYEGQLCG